MTAQPAGSYFIGIEMEEAQVPDDDADMQNMKLIIIIMYYDCLQQGVSTATINRNSIIVVYCTG